MPNIGGIVGQKAGEKSQFHISIIYNQKYAFKKYAFENKNMYYTVA